MKQKKVLREVAMPELNNILNTIPKDSEIFVDKSMQIANHIAMLLEAKGLKQKDLANSMGKSEAEISKLLCGMHNYTLRSISKLEAALGMDIINVPVTKKFTMSNLDFGIKTTYFIVSKKETMPLPRLKFEQAKVINLYHTALNNSSTSLKNNYDYAI